MCELTLIKHPVGVGKKSSIPPCLKTDNSHTKKEALMEEETLMIETAKTPKDASFFS